jgi:DNA polymerase-3 subunit beta
MKLVVSKSNLLHGVNTVIKAVPTRTTMAILECILIDASTNEIKLMANDLELGIETKVEGEIIERGIIALDAKFFAEFVRKLPDNDVTIETDEELDSHILDQIKLRAFFR